MSNMARTPCSYKIFGCFLGHPVCYAFLLYVGNGFIEGEELDAFLREFIASVNLDENIQVG